MAKFFITTTAVESPWDPYARSNYGRVIRAAMQDAVREHVSVDCPEDADFILFVGSRCQYQFDIASSPLFQKWPKRCYAFDSRDNALPRLPGIYMGIPRRLQSCGAFVYGFYIRVFDNGVIREHAPFSHCEYLFSFRGKCANAPVRSRVMALTSRESFVCDGDSGQSDGNRDHADLLAKSKFVLCPRGIGPSTWRVYEAMRTGRSPVIISDEWLAPRGPCWEEFAVAVPESEVEQIPARLRSLEHLAERMGQRAWEEWRRHFSLERSFHWLGETIRGIDARRGEWAAVVGRQRFWEAVSMRRHRVAFLREYVREAVHGRFHGMR